MSDHREPRSPRRNGDRDVQDPIQEDAFPDDLFFDGLDHAPATSHGRGLSSHPPGNRLGHAGRYCVIHKLGHGGFSTVWLCRDSLDCKYVAVKILTADVATDDLPDLRLMSLNKSDPGAEYINIPNDHFSPEGPNGICVIDFGESYQILSPPTDLGIPENYLPPEVIIEGGTSIGLACDLWALGCTLFEIRHQVRLFYMINNKDELLAEMVRFFGKLPESWWESWEARTDFFDENGKTLSAADEGYTLDTVLDNKIEVFERGSKDKNIFIVPKEEQKLCKDLLLKLLTYTPGDRLNAEEAMQYDWFKL
ncbi:related to dis1-suppressing protein kinase dsk1 [Phialocephala subalpina]|uniref:Related to dis1-suppressing protein kinase dsk1 n=1 Tax=Phialocephala subalpina TaxID=576137 RepID=A0A1L7WE85_9HELO|nr:related to dis1-suppressing protein kinase dsk1 [Phialocephala subalpina]